MYLYEKDKPSPSPSVSPSSLPTQKPSTSPTLKPSTSPTAKPSQNPTASPTGSPTAKPSASPSFSPTVSPSSSPTRADCESTNGIFGVVDEGVSVTVDFAYEVEVSLDEKGNETIQDNILPPLEKAIVDSILPVVFQEQWIQRFSGLALVSFWSSLCQSGYFGLSGSKCLGSKSVIEHDQKDLWLLSHHS